MSSFADSFVAGPNAPVSTGSGPQFNGNTYILDAESARLIRQGRDPRLVAQAELQWLRRRFVEPPHYGRARERLDETGTVLLTGESGTGRRALAKMLLHDYANGESRFQELPDRPDDPSLPPLDTSIVGSGDRLLLDLSHSEEKNHRLIQEQLPAFRATVERQQAHLVVVLPRDQHHLLRSELNQFLEEIGRPRGHVVFRRCLEADGIEFDESELDDPNLIPYLERAPMRDVAELARLVERSREIQHRDPFPVWLGKAISGMADRTNEITRDVTSLHTGRQRALLLTTAMFHGCPADAVSHATDELLNALDHPEDERPRLERCGLAEQLQEIRAGIGFDRRVHFADFNYDKAARNYFWNNFPAMRSAFGEWIGDAIKLDVLTRNDRDAVVTRFAAQCLSTENPDDLVTLINRWTQHAESTPALLQHAAAALSIGLNDERHSGAFRRQIYNWAREFGLSDDRTQLAVRMCSDIIAVSHAEQALVRLHQLARRERGELAREALLTLVREDRRLFRRLLDRIVSNMDTASWGRDLVLFLDLTEPARLSDLRTRTRPLIADSGVRAQLVTGWRSVMSRCAHHTWTDHVRAWLACADDQYGEHFKDVLVEAGHGRADLLARLYVITRDWEHASSGDPPAHTAISTELIRKIDTAQGFDPADFELRRQNERTLR